MSRIIWNGTKALGLLLGLSLVPFGVWYWMNVKPNDGFAIVFSGLSILISTASFHVMDKTNQINRRLNERDD